VKWHPACGNVALNAASLAFVADAARQIESGKIEGSVELSDLVVVLLKPDLSVPVDADVVDPFFAIKVDHSPSKVIAEHALGQLELAQTIGLLSG
jgi:hypothetical protein